MTDRELLELAAKACGGLEYVLGCDAWIHVDQHGERGAWWNPLTDDGDALRLAVKLGSRIYIYPGAGDEFTVAAANAVSVQEKHNGDPYAATRRAIVRAAAEIGRTE